MKISVNWLRELVTVDATPAEIAERLTSGGFEIEGSSAVGAELAGVIAVEIRGHRKHPKADQLRLVDVFDGREVVQVVCGAPAIPPEGARVAWAAPGSRLPGGRVIAARDIRGVSSPGMLCAEDELGLGTAHEGLFLLDEGTPPGADVAALLGGADVILEVNVTPNRPDCLGHLGVAREVAALFPGARFRPPELSLARRDALVARQLDNLQQQLDRAHRTGPAEAPLADSIAADLATITVEDAAACPRYLGRVLTGVRVGRSPIAARRRLETLGVRAISDVVDATNLALLELGHPLHAFDLDRLAGNAIVVRRARSAETLVTLDGVERRLDAEDLLICDAERPIALAGVMGGEHSGVRPDTRRILLESAYFEPSRIRRTARRLGLHTEASHRFERGADPNFGVTAGSDRCARYLADFTGATVAAGAIDVHPHPIAPRPLTLRPSRTRRVLGVDVPVEKQLSVLAALELAPAWTAAGAGSEAIIACTIPTFRPDLLREIDLVEEVARVLGYDQIPATLPQNTSAPVAGPAARALDLADRVRDALVGLGLNETISYGFTAPERLAGLGWSEGDRRARPLRLANPLGQEVSALRTSLVAGLLAALEQNLARGVTDVRLFELGAVFLPSDEEAVLPEEHTHVAAILAGEREGWLKPGGALDFYDAKGIVEALLGHLGIAAVEYRPADTTDAPWLHPGVGALVHVGGSLVGALGEVHPDLRRRLGIETPAFAFELALEPLERVTVSAFAPLPRFPGSSRDISFFVDAGVPAGALAQVIAHASALIESVTAREDYREAGKVPAGKKGMLWSIGYRAKDRTLTDDEVNREQQQVLEALGARFAVLQR